MFFDDIDTDTNTDMKMLNQPTSRLTDAIINNDMELIKQLISDNIDIINKCDFMGRAPLNQAVWDENIEIIKYLIENNANINIKSLNDCNTPLIVASKLGNLEIIKLLFDNKKNNNIENNNIEMIDFALEIVADLNHVDCVKFLIDNKADINFKSVNGNTPLSLTSNFEIIKYLVSNGAEINIVPFKKSPPLHHMIYNNCLNSVKYLIDNGADVNLQDSNGYTPLHIIAANNEYIDFNSVFNKCTDNYLKIAQCLFDKNDIQIDIKNNLGYTPLHLGFKSKRNHISNKTIHEKRYNEIGKMIENLGIESIEIIKYLISKGANINTINNEKQSLLHTACENGYKELIDFLINNYNQK